MWMLWDVVDSTTSDNKDHQWLQLPWAKILITACVIAGIILFEFRMIFIIITFVISLSIGQLLKYFRFTSRKWLRELWSLLLIGIFSIIAFLPWGLRLQDNNLTKNILYPNVQVNTLIDLVKQDYQTWHYINFYVPAGIVILGTLGWIWAIIKRDWPTASLGLWVAGMASLYLLTTLHVPWVQFVQSFAVIISLYIPIGLLLGYLMGDITNWLFRWKPGGIVVLTVIVGASLIGIWNQRDISRPDTYALVTRPDK
jgi:hypothetical protein